MDETAPHAASESEPAVTGWAVSGVFHLSVILLLALLVSEAPHGMSLMTVPTDESAGMVLQMDAAEEDGYEGDGGQGDGANHVELISPPESMAARLDEPPAADVGIEMVSPTIAESQPPSVVAQESPVPLSTSPPAITATALNAPSTSNNSGGQAGRGGVLGGSGYARVRVFGVEGRGNKFVYVFDRSASMEGPPLAAAKRQLIESLGSLASIHQFHIIFFNQRLQLFDITGGGQRIAFGSDRNKQLAANFVGGITAEGGTDRFAALKAALAYRPDVIFFLTDADDPMPPSELEDIERGRQRNGATICVIEFGRQPAPADGNFLQAIARQSGGQYGYVNTTRLKSQ